MPRLNGVLETALYVEDLERAARFYEETLGLSALAKDARFRAYDVGGRSVLLVFRRGATLETVRTAGRHDPAARRSRTAPHRLRDRRRRPCGLGGPPGPSWRRDRGPHGLAPRRPEPLRPRPGRAPARIRHAGPLGDVLGVGRLPAHAKRSPSNTSLIPSPIDQNRCAQSIRTGEPSLAVRWT